MNSKWLCCKHRDRNTRSRQIWAQRLNAKRGASFEGRRQSDLNSCYHDAKRMFSEREKRRKEKVREKERDRMDEKGSKISSMRRNFSWNIGFRHRNTRRWKSLAIMVRKKEPRKQKSSELMANEPFSQINSSKSMAHSNHLLGINFLITYWMSQVPFPCR